MSNYKYAFAVLAVFLLAVLVTTPAAAVIQPTCSPGEIWGVTVPGHYEWGSCQECQKDYVSGQYGPYGGWESGKCPGNHDSDTCEQEHVNGQVWHHHHRDYVPGHYEYTCHSGQDYRSCGANHEQHRTFVGDKYGCVAVSCPAIPCAPDYNCVSGQCVPMGTGSISGTKFFDRNNNGARDAGEEGLAGFSIELDRCFQTNSVWSCSPYRTTETAADGSYSFGALIATGYQVREIPKEGWTQTYPQNGYHGLILSNGECRTGLDFGNYNPAMLTTSYISGTKFFDRDNNGVRDASSEEGLAGWTIELTKCTLDGTVYTCTPVATTETDKDGNYIFTGLTSGDYQVREVQKSGWVQTKPVTELGQPDYYGVSLGVDGFATGLNFGNYNADLVEKPRSGHVPFTNGYWYGDLTSCDGNLKSDATETLVLPKGGGYIIVEAYSKKAIDGLSAYTLAGGDAVTAPDCCSLEYWSDQCLGKKQFGGYPVRVDLGTSIHGKLRVVAIKEETDTPAGFQIRIVIRDLMSGTVLYEGSTSGTEMIFDKTFDIQGDFSNCIANPNLAARLPKVNWPNYKHNPFCVEQPVVVTPPVEQPVVNTSPAEETGGEGQAQ